MEDILNTLKKLPPIAYGINISAPCEVIAWKRGVPGYWLIRHKPTSEAAQAFANHMNAGDCDAAQCEAMEVGAMFGFHVPAADPDVYRDGWSLLTAMIERGDFANT